MFFFLLFSSCEKNKNTYSIVDQNLKYKLDKTIKYLDSIDKYEKIDKKIIIEYIFSTNMKDTSLRIINTKPYTCDNIKGCLDYRGYKVFLYTSLKDNHIKKTFKILSKYNDCKDYVNPRPFDNGREAIVKLKNGNIVIPSSSEH